VGHEVGDMAMTWPRHRSRAQVHGLSRAPGALLVLPVARRHALRGLLVVLRGGFEQRKANSGWHGQAPSKRPVMPPSALVGIPGRAVSGTSELPEPALGAPRWSYRPGPIPPPPEPLPPPVSYFVILPTGRSSALPMSGDPQRLSSSTAMARRRTNTAATAIQNHIHVGMRVSSRPLAG